MTRGGKKGIIAKEFFLLAWLSWQSSSLVMNRPPVRIRPQAPWRAAKVTPYKAPLKEGGLTFVRHLGICLETWLSKVFSPPWRAAKVTPYTPPLKEGGLTFVRHLGICLETWLSKVFSPPWRAAKVTPYTAPLKEGGFPFVQN